MRIWSVAATAALCVVEVQDDIGIVANSIVRSVDTMA